MMMEELLTQLIRSHIFGSQIRRRRRRFQIGMGQEPQFSASSVGRQNKPINTLYKSAHLDQLSKTTHLISAHF